MNVDVVVFAALMVLFGIYLSPVIGIMPVVGMVVGFYLLLAFLTGLGRNPYQAITPTVVKPVRKRKAR